MSDENRDEGTLGDFPVDAMMQHGVPDINEFQRDAVSWRLIERGEINEAAIEHASVLMREAGRRAAEQMVRDREQRIMEVASWGSYPRHQEAIQRTSFPDVTDDDLSRLLSVEHKNPIDQESVMRHVCNAVQKSQPVDWTFAGFLLAFIRYRDQIIHDLMIDKELIDQASLPPNVLRQENESLRGMNAKLHEQAGTFQSEMENMREEIERLRIENERLESNLYEIERERRERREDYIERNYQ